MLETNESNASLKEGKNDVEVENMLSKITLMRSRDAEYGVWCLLSMRIL